MGLDLSREEFRHLLMSEHFIESPRLMLLSLSPEFMQNYLDGDLETAARLVGVRFPEGETIRESVLRRRLKQLQADETLQPWLLRAIVLRETGVMVGYIGFHDAPGADDLEEFAPGGLEIGYTVFETYRELGYATEACRALMQWAYNAHGISGFVVSISPQNVASLRIAARLGFEPVGSHIDEEDGEERIFVCELTK